MQSVSCLNGIDLANYVSLKVNPGSCFIEEIICFVK